VKIFPILIEPTEVPLALQSIRYADFTVNPELALRELIEAIRIREKNVYEIPDWKELTPSVFENLVYDLLVKEGFKVLKQTSQTRDQGFDFIARITKELPGSVPTKEKWLVQAKLYKHSKVNIQAIAQLYGYSKLANADGFLLVTNSSISTSARSFIKDNIKDVKVLVWDQSFLNDMLMKHGDTHRKYFGSKIMDSNEMVTIVDPELHKIQQMISKLKNCPEGMPGWREYEDICVEVLDYLFVPPLRKPKIQKRTESGLDVRDAIYPNRCDQGNWRYIREDYDAKYILFEFKNYATTEGGLEIDKKVVNQVRIYLK